MSTSAPRRILVVDDDKLVADVLTLILEHHGFLVTTLYNPVLAAQYALELLPHVLITDYHMPQMNGLELATRIRKHCPDCRIVITSGHIAVVAEQMGAGMDFTLLQKPVHPPVLLVAIDGLL
jgi:CheY-like chemotaxis protein